MAEHMICHKIADPNTASKWSLWKVGTMTYSQGDACDLTKIEG